MGSTLRATEHNVLSQLCEFGLNPDDWYVVAEGSQTLCVHFEDHSLQLEILFCQSKARIEAIALKA